jgi:hypothetical protein
LGQRFPAELPRGRRRPRSSRDAASLNPKLRPVGSDAPVAEAEAKDLVCRVSEHLLTERTRLHLEALRQVREPKEGGRVLHGPSVGRAPPLASCESPKGDAG